jgi:hypothetical protein
VRPGELRLGETGRAAEQHTNFDVRVPLDVVQPDDDPRDVGEPAERALEVESVGRSSGCV